MQLLPGAHASYPTLTFLVLLSFLYRCIKTTQALTVNGSYPAYHVPYISNDIDNLQTEFYPLSAGDANPYRHIASGETLNVTWLNSTTTTISIGWALCDKVRAVGFVKDSTVEYFPADGHFTSHPLKWDIREFTFRNLNTGTQYTICVYMSEVYGAKNASTYEHSKCVKISTIDHVRKDSVFFLILSLGYYGFMALLGYSQWKKKQILFRARTRKRTGSSDVTPTMRWKDLVEREHLVNDCSIEHKDTT